jgi:excisionase family DNA binding protein
LIEGSVLSILSCGLSRNERPHRLFFTVHEAQTMLGISRATAYRLIGAGRLDARKLGCRTLITAASIERLADELPKVGQP